MTTSIDCQEFMSPDHTSAEAIAAVRDQLRSDVRRPVQLDGFLRVDVADRLHGLLAGSSAWDRVAYAYTDDDGQQEIANRRINDAPAA